MGNLTQNDKKVPNQIFLNYLNMIHLLYLRWKIGKKKDKTYKLNYLKDV
ncbi:hypothetical protein ES702_07653 [subsurface metagenome]